LTGADDDEVIDQALSRDQAMSMARPA